MISIVDSSVFNPIRNRHQKLQPGRRIHIDINIDISTPRGKQAYKNIKEYLEEFEQHYS